MARPIQQRVVNGAGALAAALVTALAAAPGCSRSALTDARVAAAFDSEATLDTLHDYEVGEAAAMSRVAELEALLRESRSDARVLVLLARAWCRLGFVFTLDEHERALELGDGPLAAYHRDRARAGFERAVHFADTWLERRAPGFAKALGDAERLDRFLDSRFTADAAEPLLWAGFGRVSDAAAAPEAPGAARARQDGVRLLRRSLALAPALARGFAHVGLALDAALPPRPEPERLRDELARADAASAGTRLFVRVLRARWLACLARDRRAFEAELDLVLRSGDVAPELRLENTAAKRRARLYVTSARLDAACFAEPE